MRPRLQRFVEILTCPAELERIINKALEKDRDVRFQSSAELCADLKRLRRDTTSGKIATTDLLVRTGKPRWLWPVAIVSAVVILAASPTETDKQDAS
jgi:hypothetical protein